MPRYARAGLLTALLLTPLAGPARSDGGGWAYTAPYYPAYYSAYYPAYSYGLPVRVAYYAPAWPVYHAAPAPLVCGPTYAVAVPVMTGPLYAVPSAAPPSQVPWPPAATQSAAPGLTVIESQTGANGKAAPARDRVQVGFWNVTGRDVLLTVAGRPQTLPRNRSITLDLPRQFAWRMDERAPHTENVPETNSTLEIVLRR